MSLTADPHDFIQDQINSRAQDPDMHKDLSDALTQLTQGAKELVTELLSRNIEIKSPTSTIELEELLFEPMPV